MTDLRMPPWDKEAEEACIAAALYSERALDTLGFLRPDHFLREQHQWIWAAILDVRRRGEGANQVTVAHRLEKAGHLDDVGGRAWMAEIVAGLATAEGAEWWGRQVERDAKKRDLISASYKFIDRIYSTEDPATVATSFVARLLQDAGSARPITRSALEILNDGETPADTDVGLARQIERMIDNPLAIGGLPTGWPALDELLDGLQRSRLIVITASPNMGKSFLAHFIAWNNISDGTPVHLYTSEMSFTEVMKRLVFMEAGVDPLAWRHRGPTDAEVERVRQAQGTAKGWPLWVTNIPEIPLPVLSIEARRVQVEHKTELLIADHLQDITVPGMRRGFTEEVNAAAAGCKGIANSTNLPFVLVSHVNRESAKSGWLDMHSGHGGGNIERYANQMVSLMPVEWSDETGAYEPIADPRKLAAAKGRTRMPVMVKSDKQRAGGSGYDVRYLDWSLGGRFMPIEQ